MKPVNRSLPDARMDDIDHALGRPKNPLGQTFRDHYVASADTPTAGHMTASPHWRADSTINGGQSIVFTVTRAGRLALAAYLAEQAEERPMKPDTRVFPIMGDPYLKGVPWKWIAKYEVEAQMHHDQSISELARRGGLSIAEAVWLVYANEPIDRFIANPGRSRSMLFNMALFECP